MSRIATCRPGLAQSSEGSGIVRLAARSSAELPSARIGCTSAFRSAPKAVTHPRRPWRPQSHPASSQLHTQYTQSSSPHQNVRGRRRYGCASWTWGLGKLCGTFRERTSVRYLWVDGVGVRVRAVAQGPQRTRQLRMANLKMAAVPSQMTDMVPTN